MASDINPAVGDGARRMTYVELAQARAADGVGQGPGTEPTPDEERPGPAEAAPEKGSGTDPLTAIGMQTLSQAVEMLREDVERERDRANRAEDRVEALYAALIDERRRVLEILTSPALRPRWRRWFR